MRALGVDFGSRRIGLAVLDRSAGVAVPLANVPRRSDASAAASIGEVARRERADLLVVGIPLGLDGAAGAAARRVERFASRLASATGLQVVRVAETLTSHEAERRLREAGVDPRRHPERVDPVAAQILLEEALAEGLLERGGETA